MPVHLRSQQLTAQAWNAPWCTGGFSQGWPGLQLRWAGLHWLALDQARVALLGEEGGEQHLEVIGAAMQAAAAQGTFGGLHHCHQGAVAAEGALPGAGGCQAKGGGELLYSRAR